MSDLDKLLKKKLDRLAREIVAGFNSLESNNLAIEIGYCPRKIRESVVEGVREGTIVGVVGCDNFSRKNNIYRVDFHGLVDYMKISLQ